MALFKDDKDEEKIEKVEKIEKTNSMKDFLFSQDNDNKTNKSTTNKQTTNKSSTLMFGGDYSKNRSVENNEQNNGHKKIPMFGDTNTNKTNNQNNINKKYTFDFSTLNSRPYNVVNFEHQKLLVDLRALIDYYTNIFTDDDKKKIIYLIDQLKGEL